MLIGKVGDTVVYKNEQRSKLDPKFNPDRYRVTGLQASDMTCTSEEGKVIRRNVTWAKKLEMPVESKREVESRQSPVESAEVNVPRTSGRERRLPARLQDYAL